MLRIIKERLHLLGLSLSEISSESKAFFIISLFVASQFFLLGGGVLWDEAVFLSNSQSLVGASSFSEGFRPPLLPVMLTPFSSSLLFSRAFMIIIAAASLIVAFFITRSWLAVLLLSVNHQFFFWSGFAYSEVPTTLFLLLGILFFRKPLLAGFFFSLAALTRFSAGLTSVIVLIYFFVYWRGWRPVILFLAGSLLPVIPWLAHNFVAHSNPLWDLLAYYHVISSYTTSQPLFPFLLLLIIDLAPLLLLVGRFKSPWFWSFTAFLFLHLFLIGLKLPRYELSLLPFIIGMVDPVLLRMVDSRIFKRVFFLLVFLMAIPGIVFGIRDRLLVMGCGSSFVDASSFLKEEGSSLVVSNSWPQLGYLSGVDAHSLYTNNLSEIFQNVTPDHIMVVNGIGDPFDESLISSVENVTFWFNSTDSAVVHYDGSFTGLCYTIRSWSVDYNPGR